MATTDAYPERCAFCPISKAYPAGESSVVPTAPNPEKIDPQCHLILSSPHVLAFLDILPIAPAHILVTTRKHYRKISDLNSPQNPESEKTSLELGRYLPIISRALCRATGVEDWNVVQNNGVRAAQVVPHVHFHLIPRYQEGQRERFSTGQGVAQKGTEKVDWGMLKSWKMFGRGARTDLDEEEGKQMATVLREALRVELGESMREGGKCSL